MLENLLENVRERATGRRDEEPEEQLEELPSAPDDLSGLEDLDDVEAMPQDPKPKRKRAGRVRPAAPARVSAAVRRQVADSLQVMIVFPATAWAMRDPICGGKMLEQAEASAKALAPIICRNPQMLAWFTNGGGLMDFLAVGSALSPVATTFWGHHISHTIGHDHEGEQGGAADYRVAGF
jgi:hypothetical protein